MDAEKHLKDLHAEYSIFIKICKLWYRKISKDDQVKEWIEKYGSIDVIILEG